METVTDYKSLSTAELINIITNDKSGRTGEAVSYKTCESVPYLAMLREDELQELEGIGTTKARQIRAAVELGSRLRYEHRNQKKITCSKDIVDLLFAQAFSETIEHFWIMFLRNNNSVICCKEMSRGGIGGVALDVRLVLREALSCCATGLVMVHNHPSGTNKPSREDRDLTFKMYRSANTMDIRLVDHVIITSDERAYYSFHENGEI